MKKLISLLLLFLSQIALVSAQNTQETAMMNGVVGLFLFGVILVFAIGILGLIFTIFMLIDCSKRRFETENDRLLWIIIIILLAPIGAVIYYFLVRHPKGRA